MNPLEVLEAIEADIATADNESLSHFPGTAHHNVFIEGMRQDPRTARGVLWVGSESFIVTIERNTNGL